MCNPLVWEHVPTASEAQGAKDSLFSLFKMSVFYPFKTSSFYTMATVVGNDPTVDHCVPELLRLFLVFPVDSFEIQHNPTFLPVPH